MDFDLPRPGPKPPGPRKYQGNLKDKALETLSSRDPRTRLPLARFAEEVGSSTRVPIFDKLGPPLPMQDHLGDFRPRLVKSAFHIPPRRIQPTTRPAVGRKGPQPDTGGNAGSRRKDEGKDLI
ncbi:hypothetical protein Q3G72_025846 [Acer saccharum]|nr:hypothetical protein Q3G72_025846 [Acer saccharum]